MSPTENPEEMRILSKEPRRPNLATIVGSGLAVVAAGSLIAFSSLAEQAGLQGLAAGGLQPAQPARGGKAHPITVPAPAPTTAPPRDPRDALAELARDSIVRAVPARPAPTPFTPRGTEPEKTRAKAEPRRIETRARVAVSDKKPKPGGPPYGHAYGYHKAPGEKPEPAKHAGKSKPAKSKKQKSKGHGPQQPVRARGNGNGKAKHEAKHEAKPPKPPKPKKVAKAPSNGNGNGKAKGHSKHAPGRGKGKGHSKHGR